MSFRVDPSIHRSTLHGILQAGAGPFITFRSYQLAAGRRIIWKAREHRKGLLRAARAMEHLPVPLWKSRGYNRLMGGTFAVGSALFILGSVLSMLPQASAALLAWANVIFFMGSIPFTLAAYMQHFQAANTSSFTPDPEGQARHTRIQLLGWQPRDAGWLSTLTQFLGTLAFNVSTLSAAKLGSLWYLQDLLVWAPDMLGSVLFLVSAYLAFVEANHSFWRWRLKDLDWQIVFVNLVGCIAFMIAACTAFVPQQGQSSAVALFSNAQLMLGAVCFLIGALLAVREAKAADCV